MSIFRPYLGDIFAADLATRPITAEWVSGAVDAHLAGDKIATAYLRFRLRFDWRNHWITPRQYLEARSRATVYEWDEQTWVKTSWGGSVPGITYYWQNTCPKAEDAELWAR